MKVCVFIIFIVIQATLCEKAISKLQRKWIVPKMNNQCKKIKCPSVEDPQCVQMRRRDLTLIVHVIAVNKCELEYMKCHKDVEAKIVAMKYCSHNDTLTAGKKKSETDKMHIRVKRQADKPQDANLGDKEENGNKTEEIKEPEILRLKKKRKGRKSSEDEPRLNGKNRKIKPKKQRVNDRKLPLLWKSKYGHAFKKFKTLKGNKLRQFNTSNALMHSYFHIISTESDTDDEINERKRIYKGISGHPVLMQNGVSNFKPSLLQPKAFKLQTQTENGLLENSEISSLETLTTKLSSESEQLVDFPMISEESANSSLGKGEVDKTEYDEACPAVCPARDVMVCGKCRHGIYKTFNSVCHLRMFICKYHDEELDLISRRPCVFSAPYLSAPKLMPKGRITEKNDDDKILRYIRCRDYGLLEKQTDPRCNFPKEKENLKFFDFKGVQINMFHNIAENSKTSEDENSEY